MPDVRDWTIAIHDTMFGLFRCCSGCGKRLATGMAGVLPTDTIAVAYFLCDDCYSTNRLAAERRQATRYQSMEEA